MLLMEDAHNTVEHDTVPVGQNLKLDNLVMATNYLE